MPESYTQDSRELRHSDDMEDIITAVPPGIIRWGISIFFALLVMLIGLSSLIRYPDIVKTSLTINSPNSPKPIVAKTSGKLVKLLVKEDENVNSGQPLAFIESTANHDQVIKLSVMLKQLRKQLSLSEVIGNDLYSGQNKEQLGELQVDYEYFFKAYLSYRTSVGDGSSVKKRTYLEKDLVNLKNQELQLVTQQKIQQRDFNLAEDEYQMHQKLTQQKVETIAELRQQESKYLAKQSPMVQTRSAIIAANTTYSDKQKEILELDNQIMEEKDRFFQALNSLISQVDDWMNKYVLSASQAGKLSFAGTVQENQVLNANQDVFYINPGNARFYGVIDIPQSNLGKVKAGQDVLIKLKSYPFEEYGVMRGKIKNVAEVPYRDSVFISNVIFTADKSPHMKAIILKQGMKADADIITQNATLMQRISRNFTKLIGN